jgi:hypothetical protein
MKRLALPIALCAALVTATLAGGTASAQVYGQQGYGNAPAGSYQQTCNGIRVRGNGLLTANCLNNGGQRVRSSLAFQSCRGGDIGNINGQLSCVRGGSGYYGRGHGRRGNHRGGRYRNRDNDDNNNGNPGALPSGSYQQSCNNASMQGSTLTANCRNDSGAYMTSYLDVSQCRSTDDIGNLNGQLRCIYRY